MLNEMRFAFRSLSKSPAFMFIAVLTLALAIGANTAVFSLINALLIRPLPYRAPDLLQHFKAVAIALVAVALLASYIPALRATRADPMIALGHNA